jgi:hypothetical protein
MSLGCTLAHENSKQKCSARLDNVVLILSE